MRIALGQEEAAAPLLTEVVEDARRRDDPWLLGLGLVGVGMTRTAEDPALPALFEEAVQALRRSGDSWSVAFALVPHGNAALLSGDPAAGRTHLAAAAALHRAGQDREGLAYCLDGLAGLALLTGDARSAARLSGAADAVRTALGMAVWPMLRPLMAQLTEGIRAALGEAADRAVRAEGAAADPWALLDDTLSRAP
jgi:hypothetical protein